GARAARRRGRHLRFSGALSALRADRHACTRRSRPLPRIFKRAVCHQLRDLRLAEPELTAGPNPARIPPTAKHQQRQQKSLGMKNASKTATFVFCLLAAILTTPARADDASPLK